LSGGTRRNIWGFCVLLEKRTRNGAFDTEDTEITEGKENSMQRICMPNWSGFRAERRIPREKPDWLLAKRLNEWMLKNVKSMSCVGRGIPETEKRQEPRTTLNTRKKQKAER
jgi:hypothetical protein